MSPGRRAIADQLVLRHGGSATCPEGKNRYAFLSYHLKWVFALLVLAPVLSCGRNEGPPPTATPTVSPSPSPAFTGTPTPRPTALPTPTLVATPKVSPTRRTLSNTNTPAPIPTTPAPTAEETSPTIPTGVNLLTNPGFEGPYTPYQGKTEWNVPEGWVPWSFQQGGFDFPPEFKPAEAPALSRIHGGARAIQYFKSFATYHAGVFQKVEVAPGVKLRFTIYGQAWSRDRTEQCQSVPIEQSCSPAFMGMRIGIDPLGGGSPKSESIEWSAHQSPTDGWALFTVEAVAEADVVTVFTWSAPNNPRVNQDTYWDDATLEVTP